MAENSPQSWVPPEFDRLHNGAKGSEGGGLGMWDGSYIQATWGFDADRGMFFRSETWSASRLEGAPRHSADLLTSRKKASAAVREVRTDKYGTIAVVTTLAASRDDFAKFACMANALLAVPPSPPDEHAGISMVSDGAWHHLGLVSNGQSMNVTESWEAKQIERNIDELIESSLEGTAQ